MARVARAGDRQSGDARMHWTLQGRGRSAIVQGAGKSFYRFGEDHPREVKQGGRGAVAETKSQEVQKLRYVKRYFAR